MKVILLGAAGFIGTNLAIRLSHGKDNFITVADRNEKNIINLKKNVSSSILIKATYLDIQTDFDTLLDGQEVVYHLFSSSIPATSNQKISEELSANVITTSKMLDACVRNGIKRVIFISSGGTVYGKESNCPLKEEMETYPISSYGVQKITIEKLLYLYQYLYGLDYRIIRLSNPYGPYQKPNGILGAVTTFTYKALKNETISVYGDGSVIRDYIYIDDAVRGIINIAEGEKRYKTYNLGSGKGISIIELIRVIEKSLNCDVNVSFSNGRKADVPVNYLDISRYENDYGKLNPISLEDGIKKTAFFLKNNYI